MWTDEIVEETRQAREQYAAQFNYELEAIYRDLKKREEEITEKFVSLPAANKSQRISRIDFLLSNDCYRAEDVWQV
jgi:hypothetical protein